MHRARFLILLALVALPPSVAGAAEQPLAAQWHLDQTTDDGTRTPDSGPNNLVSATPGSPTVVPGRFSNAFRLAVAPSRVEVDGTPVLTPAQLTVMAWVRRTGSPGTYRYVVARGDRDCAAASYALYTGSTGGLGSTSIPASRRCRSRPMPGRASGTARGTRSPGPSTAPGSGSTSTASRSGAAPPPLRRRSTTRRPGAPSSGSGATPGLAAGASPATSTRRASTTAR